MSNNHNNNQPRVAVVDGSNVAFIERSKNGAPKVGNLVAVRRYLEQKGWHPIIIVDASLRHQVDDPQQLEVLIDHQQVLQAPAGTDADFFVLKTAEQHHAVIISNDAYAPFQKQFPWIGQRRIPLMIVEGQVELYEKEKVQPALQRNARKRQARKDGQLPSFTKFPLSGIALQSRPTLSRHGSCCLPFGEEDERHEICESEHCLGRSDCFSALAPGSSARPGTAAPGAVTIYSEPEASATGGL